MREVGAQDYSYTYDNNGNMTAELDQKDDYIREFAWNEDNRLTEVVRDEYGTSSYVYDALGRRIVRTSGTTSTFYYYDGLTVIAEKQKVGAGAWEWKRIFTVAPGVIGNIFRISEMSGGNWTDSYYHYDAIGNVVLRTNGYGGVLESLDQEAYGNVKLGSQSGYHIHVKEFDTLCELYYFNLRWYDLSIGRFIQPGSPYTFSKNNPGMTAKEERKAIKECYDAIKSDADRSGACGSFGQRMCGDENNPGALSRCLSQKGITLTHCRFNFGTPLGDFHSDCSINCDDGGGCIFGDIDIWPINFPPPYGLCSDNNDPPHPVLLQMKMDKWPSRVR